MSDLDNIKRYLEDAEKQSGETIEAIVVGVHDDRRWDEKDPLPDENVILSREAGMAKLDEEYDSGYGGADCYPMYAWSKSWVFFIHEYDGATSLASVPRHPIATKPEFS